ncbi:MAG: hypothetical protein A2096_17245 [Spirochaetes bacterium GWF1_41_5]|nr:MAG: hypothetical protein A2096_17245 [Spirochaetes bacterium GWF1_41_5]HBE03141.1 alpha/beta hydrolase [Spirochaetia bacterium]
MTVKIDNYTIKPETGRGAVIIFPGGGYAKLAPHEGEPVARFFNSRGLHAFVCNYRVAPDRHPAPIIDAKRAIRTVRYNAAEYNLNPQKIAVLGFSAGGHLVSSLGCHFDRKEFDITEPADEIDFVSCRPDALILCYPVISLLDGFGHIGSCRNLLGENPEGNLPGILSSHTQVKKNTPPVFLWHTADDPGVPVMNSISYASACVENGVPVELHVFASGKHGLGLAEGTACAVWPELCVKWLINQGW